MATYRTRSTSLLLAAVWLAMLVSIANAMVRMTRALALYELRAWATVLVYWVSRLTTAFVALLTVGLPFLRSWGLVLLCGVLGPLVDHGRFLGPRWGR